MDKIFLIGFGKTGTVSVHKVLQAMGYNSCHDKSICDKTVRLIAQGEDPKALEEYDAFTDGHCLNDLWFEIYSRFPNAKFILTVRDAKEWIDSRLLHIAYNRVTGRNATWRDINTKKEVADYERHNRMVEKIFGDSPNFIKLDVSKNNTLKRLADFLGKEVPEGMEFMEIVNTGLHKLKMMREVFEKRRNDLIESRGEAKVPAESTPS